MRRTTVRSVRGRFCKVIIIFLEVGALHSSPCCLAAMFHERLEAG